MSLSTLFQAERQAEESFQAYRSRRKTQKQALKWAASRDYIFVSTKTIVVDGLMNERTVNSLGSYTNPENRIFRPKTRAERRQVKISKRLVRNA